MPEFNFIARELSGEKVLGTLTAANRPDVVNVLAGRSLTAIKVEPLVVKPQLIPRKVPSRVLAAMYSQLADLLHAGVPLLQAIDILRDQDSHPALTSILTNVRETVADGSSLADAMRLHPRVFANLTTSIVRAGEEGGFVEESLKRIAAFTNRQEDLKGRVVGALAYPAFLMVTGIVVVVVLLVYFVPSFAPMFERLEEQGNLPLPTTVLMSVSGFLQDFGIWMAIPLAAIVCWAIRYANTSKGRYQFDKWRIELKGVGSIVRSLAIARFCRVFGTLLQNGVPILRSLQIAKDATGNLVLATAIEQAAENISEGKSLAHPLAVSGQFPKEFVEMIAVGEKANRLEQILLDFANAMEERTNRRVDLFVRMLEPAMLLVMAVLVLFVVVALLLPVFEISGSFS